MRQQMLYVATALGSTYEHVSSDYSKVTYLSARAALLDFRRSIERIQHQVIGHMLCRFIWSRWFDQAVLSGAIPVSPRELLRNREDVTDVRWVPPGWDWIDPGKDAEANIALVRAGFTSRTEVVAERGYDIEEVDREIAAEQQRADQAGLKFDSDGRNARSGAQAKPPEPNSEATPADEPRQDQKRKGAA
jgi:lambda family phage portal protein